MLVGINEYGRIEYRYELGSGVGLVQSSEPVTVGTLYNVTLLRYSKPNSTTVIYVSTTFDKLACT